MQLFSLATNYIITFYFLFSLAFVRENKISITEFSDKVCKIPRAHVSLYFNQNVPWHKATSALRAAFINVAFWMDLDPKRRIEKIKPENELVKTASVSSLTKYNNIDVIEEAKTVISMAQENTNEFVDTEVSQSHVIYV